MKTFKLFSIALLAAVIFSSCQKDEDEEMMNQGDLKLNITGLEDLGADYVYEGWIIVDGAPVTTGIFSVDGEGNLSKSSFSLNPDDVSKASAFVLTIEPSNDPDPAPSKVHILAGDISNGMANLSVGHAAALGNDFSSASGKYFLATPTDDDDSNEKSGVWFLDPSSGSPMPSLNLPTLSEGWAYEGWAVINGVPVSTGTFTMFDKQDNAAPYSGMKQGPPFPGEDFLIGAPNGLNFPTDLSGSKIVISIEPVPDNSANPFLLKPLLADVASDAGQHTPYMFGNISMDTNPGGSASLNIR